MDQYTKRALLEIVEDCKKERVDHPLAYALFSELYTAILVEDEFFSTFFENVENTCQFRNTVNTIRGKLRNRIKLTEFERVFFEENRYEI